MTTHFPDALCVDCGLCTCMRHLAEYYMVTRQIWRRHGAGRGMLCIGCLEARLGRQLTQRDFLDVKINTRVGEGWVRQSHRLRLRLTEPPGPLAKVNP